jgi:hypothetical protein
VEGNEKCNNHLQEILNKTNKNDYILLSRDLNARIGNAEIHNIVRSFGELVTNTNGLKLRDFATYNNNINPLNAELNLVCHLFGLLEAHPILHVSRIRVKITNSLYKHNTIRTHTHGQLATAT